MAITASSSETPVTPPSAGVNPSTARLEGSIKRWMGHSSGSKPSPRDGSTGAVPVGSSFLESDTGRIFRWDGEEWRYSEDHTQIEMLSAILLELRLLRELTELRMELTPA